MKKQIAVILAFIMVFATMPLSAFAAGDTTAPIINSITIDKASIGMPDTFSLTFDFTEEETGVSRIDVWFIDTEHATDANDINAAISSEQNYMVFSEPKFTGQYTMDFSVDTTLPTDHLRIGQIDIYDSQGNTRMYTSDGSSYYVYNGKAFLEADGRNIPKCFVNNNNLIQVDTSGKLDKTAPLVNSVTINNEGVTSPGEFSLTFNLTEEQSGVTKIGVSFMGKLDSEDRNDINTAIYSEQNYQTISTPLMTGEYTMNFSVSDKYPSEAIRICQIDVYDGAGNHRMYVSDGSEEFIEDGNAFLGENGLDSVKSYVNMGNVLPVSFTGERDKTAPLISSINFNKKSLTKPGAFKLSFNFVEEGSGVSKINVWFNDNINEADPNNLNAHIYSIQNGQNFSKKRLTGSCTMNFSVDSGYPTDNIQIGQVDIYDKQGNHRMYMSDGSEYFIEDENAFIGDNGTDSEKCYINYRNAIEVVPEFDVNFQSHVANPENVSKLESMPEGQVAMINYDSNNPVAKAEFFEAIAGTDKTIVFSNNAYQWVFKGNDISEDNTKDISLDFNFSNANLADYGLNDNAVKLVFPDNGVLPGKAEIRLKSDYLYSRGQASNLTLYYYNNGQFKEEADPDFELVFDGTDKWCRFEVTHNSVFYISPSALNKYKSPATKISKLKRAKKAFRVSWKKKKCTGYQLMYSRYSNMKSAKKIKIMRSSTSSKLIKKLESNKNYYVQVRTYTKVAGKNYYSGWSDKKRIRTK